MCAPSTASQEVFGGLFLFAWSKRKLPVRLNEEFIVAFKNCSMSENQCGFWAMSNQDTFLSRHLDLSNQSVTNNIINGCIPLKCSSARSACCLTGSLACLGWSWAIYNVITCQIISSVKCLLNMSRVDFPQGLETMWEMIKESNLKILYLIWYWICMD